MQFSKTPATNYAQIFFILPLSDYCHDLFIIAFLLALNNSKIIRRTR